MTVRIKPILFIGLIFLLLGEGLLPGNGAVSHADNLSMPEVDSQPPNDNQGVLRPVRGLTMDEVRSKFGEPLQVDGPVGNPPITRWSYDHFTVVFESNYVIDSYVPK